MGTSYACNQIGVSAKCASTALDNFLELASFEHHERLAAECSTCEHNERQFARQTAHTEWYVSESQLR